jgi:hypothetical protein
MFISICRYVILEISQWGSCINNCKLCVKSSFYFEHHSYCFDESLNESRLYFVSVYGHFEKELTFFHKMFVTSLLI